MPQWEYDIDYAFILTSPVERPEDGPFLLPAPATVDLALLWEDASEEEPAMARLNKRGAAGWELVNAFPVPEWAHAGSPGTKYLAFVFKRPLAQPE